MIVRFTVTVTLDDEQARRLTLHRMAEDLFDYMCDGGDGIVDYPAWIDSVDGVDWAEIS